MGEPPMRHRMQRLDGSQSKGALSCYFRQPQDLADDPLVKESRYKYIRTHTKNKYRDMLLLNIKHGFDVIGVQTKLKDTEPTIILEKEL